MRRGIFCQNLDCKAVKIYEILLQFQKSTVIIIESGEWWLKVVN